MTPRRLPLAAFAVRALLTTPQSSVRTSRSDVPRIAALLSLQLSTYSGATVQLELVGYSVCPGFIGLTHQYRPLLTGHIGYYLRTIPSQSRDQ